VPDAPVSLANNAAVTDNLAIAITWSDGSSDGGTSILDYKLWYALDSDEYQVLEEVVLNQYYTTTVTLVTGSDYKFKV
jgi:hypothetical protein